MKLDPFMDFRKPEHRREVFLRFYEFHLRYRAHPGGVYFLIPHLARELKWDIEQKLWYAFINSLTQHPVTSYLIFSRLSEPPRSEQAADNLGRWFNTSWKTLSFDIDRRRQKALFPEAVKEYSCRIRQYGGQEKFWMTENPDFREIWRRVTCELCSLGRLGAWSGTEFIKIASGSDIVYDSLMLEDIDGSHSHRTGLRIILGRDQKEPDTPENIASLTSEGAKLLAEARRRLKDVTLVNSSHIGYETLESTLCCYKSWHRRNRRYPNVYMDMMHDRIKKSEHLHPESVGALKIFWEAREEYLPGYLRQECNPTDPGLSPPKQNFYLNTGKIVMMDLDWPCFANDNSWRKPTPLV